MHAPNSYFIGFTLVKTSTLGRKDSKYFDIIGARNILDHIFSWYSSSSPETPFYL